MASAQEIRDLNGRRASFELHPDAGAGENLTGTVVGTLEAADGLVVSVAPDYDPERRVTLNYQHIRSYRED